MYIDILSLSKKENVWLDYNSALPLDLIDLVDLARLKVWLAIVLVERGELKRLEFGTEDLFLVVLPNFHISPNKISINYYRFCSY